jgi:hypothetical protein
MGIIEDEEKAIAQVNDLLKQSGSNKLDKNIEKNLLNAIKTDKYYITALTKAVQGIGMQYWELARINQEIQKQLHASPNYSKLSVDEGMIIAELNDAERLLFSIKEDLNNALKRLK